MANPEALRKYSCFGGSQRKRLFCPLPQAPVPEFLGTVPRHMPFSEGNGDVLSACGSVMLLSDHYRLGYQRVFGGELAR